MPKMNIDKSIVINKKPGEIFKYLNDFNEWVFWSPWLITDPDAKTKVSEDGKYNEWDGKVVGSGNMTILSEKENESIDYNLTFLKPWKSKAKVSFILKPTAEGTEVHWTMESGLPFFLFWMKKMMVAFIGMDYDRGLGMLKSYAEEGKVPSKLNIKGNTNH